ncbi:MAG: hypothetical protein V4584_07065 [Verrucomicrobiota bacterium]
MIRHFTAFFLASLILLQDASAVALYYAFIDTIRGKVVAIDTKTGVFVDGYTLEVDPGTDQEALAKVRSALISDTRHDYRKFERPRKGQILLLVRKEEKLKFSVGDRVDIRGYSIIGGSDNGPKDGEPRFKTFTKIQPAKQAANNSWRTTGHKLFNPTSNVLPRYLTLAQFEARIHSLNSTKPVRKSVASHVEMAGSRCLRMTRTAMAG